MSLFTIFVSEFKSDEVLFCFEDIGLGFEMVFILLLGYIETHDLSLSSSPFLLFPT